MSRPYAAYLIPQKIRGIAPASQVKKMLAIHPNIQPCWVLDQIALVILDYHQLSQKASAWGGFGHAKGVIEKNPKAIFFKEAKAVPLR